MNLLQLNKTYYLDEDVEQAADLDGIVFKPAFVEIDLVRKDKDSDDIAVTAMIYDGGDNLNWAIHANFAMANSRRPLDLAPIWVHPLIDRAKAEFR